METTNGAQVVRIIWSPAQLYHALTVAVAVLFLRAMSLLWQDYLTTIAAAVVVAQALYLRRAELDTTFPMQEHTEESQPMTPDAEDSDPNTPNASVGIHALPEPMTPEKSSRWPVSLEHQVSTKLAKPPWFMTVGLDLCRRAWPMVGANPLVVLAAWLFATLLYAAGRLLQTALVTLMRALLRPPMVVAVAIGVIVWAAYRRYDSLRRQLAAVTQRVYSECRRMHARLGLDRSDGSGGRDVSAASAAKRGAKQWDEMRREVRERSAAWLLGLTVLLSTFSLLLLAAFALADVPQIAADSATTVASCAAEQQLRLRLGWAHALSDADTLAEAVGISNETKEEYCWPAARLLLGRGGDGAVNERLVDASFVDSVLGELRRCYPNSELLSLLLPAARPTCAPRWWWRTRRRQCDAGAVPAAAPRLRQLLLLTMQQLPPGPTQSDPPTAPVTPEAAGRWTRRGAARATSAELAEGSAASRPGAANATDALDATDSLIGLLSGGVSDAYSLLSSGDSGVEFDVQGLVGTVLQLVGACSSWLLIAFRFVSGMISHGLFLLVFYPITLRLLASSNDAIGFANELAHSVGPAWRSCTRPHPPCSSRPGLACQSHASFHPRAGVRCWAPMLRSPQKRFIGSGWPSRPRQCVQSTWQPRRQRSCSRRASSFACRTATAPPSPPSYSTSVRCCARSAPVPLALRPTFTPLPSLNSDRSLRLASRFSSATRRPPCHMSAAVGCRPYSRGASSAGWSSPSSSAGGKTSELPSPAGLDLGLGSASAAAPPPPPPKGACHARPRLQTWVSAGMSTRSPCTSA